jgi:hypothetical protein
MIEATKSTPANRSRLPPLLAVNNVEVVYDNVILVLRV